MQSRNIILGIVGAAVLGALVLLLLEVRGDSKPDLSAEKRARALAEYRRRAAKSQSEAVKPPSATQSKGSSPARTRERRLPRPPTRIERPRALGRERRPSPSRTARRPDLARPEIEAPAGDESDPAKKRMTEATQFYDQGNYPAAQEVALEVLKKDPNNVKMLRVAVSTLCATGEVEKASKYLRLLPSRDRSQMKRRCKKWGAEFE